MSYAHQARRLIGSTIMAVFAVPSHSAIFERDDRQYVSPIASPLYSVGLVESGALTTRRTTGVLVDECHVLTSESILGYGLAPLGRRVTFDVGMGTRQHMHSSGRVIAAGGREPIRDNVRQREVGDRDWVLIRLKKCIGKMVGYALLKTGPYSPYEFNHVQSVGYPQGRSIRQGITLDPSCRIIGGAGTVWLNDCATMRGDAGGPIFRVLPGAKHMEVYAIQTAGYVWSKKPIRLAPWYENQAVPIDLIAPQIEPYLSLNARRLAHPANTAVSK
jgi:hypothetical protein